MNLQELVTKVTTDTNENPYITLEDIKGVSDEFTSKETRIQELEEENKKIQEDLDKKKSEYDLLKSRIVDSVLTGKKIEKSDEDKRKEEENKRDTLSFKDLLKK